MNYKKLQEFLGWSIMINLGLLIFSVLMFLLAHDWVYEIHSNFITVSVETYDAIWFITIAFWKILVFVFNVIPYIAIRIINKK